jgi:hypothetical protein
MVASTRLVHCTKRSAALKKVRDVAENNTMTANIEPIKTHSSNRNVPVEQWPESLEILRHLATQSRAMSIKELAHDVSAPEISTRNRLARLEVLGAVVASRATAILGPGRHVTCAHYVITQYGRDCAVSRGNSSAGGVSHLCVNSVFALARAMNLSI